MSFGIVPNTGYTSIQQDGVDALLYNQGGASFNMNSVTCTQGSGALTFTLNPCILKVRSTILTTGVPVERNLNVAATLVLPSGGTLGAVTIVTARLVLVLLDNSGTLELAVINIAGGKDLSETGVINTTAISAASTANNVFYSTSARTGVAYRVVGLVDAVNTAGAWGNPTLVQGAGGNALTNLSSLGQTWQNLTGSRALGTTYYNTSGKKRYISATVQTANGSSYSWQLNGASLGTFTTGNTPANYSVAYWDVNPGESYTITSGANITLIQWSERQ